MATGIVYEKPPRARFGGHPRRRPVRALPRKAVTVTRPAGGPYRQTTYAPEPPPTRTREYSLAAELVPAWADKPLALTYPEGRIIPVLPDPGSETLDRFLERDKEQPLDLALFLRSAINLATALGHAHQRGLIHKDVKPENVLVDEYGHVWLAGFVRLLAKGAGERCQTAVGQEADLRRCLSGWRFHGRIDPFRLGTDDSSNRLLMPEKLYGRGREINSLVCCSHATGELRERYASSSLAERQVMAVVVSGPVEGRFVADSASERPPKTNDADDERAISKTFGIDG